MYLRLAVGPASLRLALIRSSRHSDTDGLVPHLIRGRAGLGTGLRDRSEKYVRNGTDRQNEARGSPDVLFNRLSCRCATDHVIATNGPLHTA